MPDNFDLNVARRKPNTRTRRPVHPWDVPVPGEDVTEDAAATDEVTPSANETSEPEEDSGATAAEAAEPARAQEPSRAKPAANVRPKPAPSESSTARPPSDLSATINIHSNYCKLHNDVSDHLFRLLSPSAQAVYLRLYRQSYGWNRNWAAESLPKLTTACNISLQTVRKAIKELETTGAIRKQFSDYHKATVYRVYLPSEMNLGIPGSAVSDMAQDGGQESDMPEEDGNVPAEQHSAIPGAGLQKSNTDRFNDPGMRYLEGENAFLGGQKTDIQSVYHLGTSIYDMLADRGALPKNMYKNMTNIHLARAVDVLDEFYDSIGFSVVSRSQYRKSLIDYFEILRSGFSADDIRYAVRWTFKNSRSRPESFSLIKHTMHLAMEDLIRDLKAVSGEKDLADEKQRALKRRSEWESAAPASSFTHRDLETWTAVVARLKDDLNENTFSAFIEPLRLVSADGLRVTLSAPPDSMSWVADHFLEPIKDAYRLQTGKGIDVELS